jgi:hypothetical protein
MVDDGDMSEVQTGVPGGLLAATSAGERAR